MFKTTKVKNQYGRTVYKKTTSHKKKEEIASLMKFRFFLFVLLLSVVNAFASDLDFTLVNQTGQSFEGLYITASDNKDSDANILLDGKVLAAGEKIRCLSRMTQNQKPGISTWWMTRDFQ